MRIITVGVGYTVINLGIYLPSGHKTDYVES